MSDFCVRPTQILNNAFRDYEAFIKKCNGNSENSSNYFDDQRSTNENQRFANDDQRSMNDKTTLFNGINSESNIDISKNEYIKQERQQKMETDVLKDELEIAENDKTDDEKNKENVKEGFNSNDGFKITLDLKTILIIILIIVVIYIYSLYITTRSKMKYMKKILKFKRENGL